MRCLRAMKVVGGAFSQRNRKKTDFLTFQLNCKTIQLNNNANKLINAEVELDQRCTVVCWQNQHEKPLLATCNTPQEVHPLALRVSEGKGVFLILRLQKYDSRICTEACCCTSIAPDIDGGICCKSETSNHQKSEIESRRQLKNPSDWK